MRKTIIFLFLILNSIDREQKTPLPEDAAEMFITSQT